MKTTLRWTLSVGFALTGGLMGSSHTATAASSETTSAITIHVRNYAGVAPKTLAEAQEVSAGIFRKAGLETRWADIVLTAENNPPNSADGPAYTPADIQLNILPREMSDRSGLPDNVMGLAPGSGFDRTMVYVFDNKVETFFWGLVRAHCSGRMNRPVSKAQILGHVIAHEVGHLLLNLQAHSKQGIMRGDCGLMEMRDAAYETLLFTSQQAEVLRADVRRRNTQEETLKLAGVESAASAH